jgi:flavin reductase (DIM6/NTAB) family NADH-FMN oxidoreductase RutF
LESGNEFTMPFDSELQRRIMGNFATGVTVVTTCVGNELFGMTANAVTSLSLDPPLVLVCVDKKAGIMGPLRDSRVFAMNILSADQQEISRRFAKSGPKDFSDLRFTTAVSGSPILTEAIAYVDCRVVEVIPGGDHEIFIGEILTGDMRGGKPLLFFCGKYGRLDGP